MTMRIYLDMCCLQRPLDDKSQLRVLIEAEAVLGILYLCNSGEADLISSEALIFENERNSNAIRRDFATQVLAKAKEFVQTNVQINLRAQELIDAGVKAIDASHLAIAIESRCDFFCTCDDRLMKRARALNTDQTKVVLPLELFSELQL